MERILYYDKEKIIPNFLVSYTYSSQGENIIGFHLYETNSFARQVYFEDAAQQECSLNAFKNALDKIFVHEYGLIYTREPESSIIEDIILKKQDVDSSLLNGIKVISATDCGQFNTMMFSGKQCFSNKDDMVSGLEILVTNGYAVDGKFFSKIGTKIPSLAKKGAWGACSNL